MAGIIGAKGITCKDRVENYILDIEVGENFKMRDMTYFLRKHCSRTECSALLARDDRVTQVGVGLWRRIK